MSQRSITRAWQGSTGSVAEWAIAKLSHSTRVARPVAVAVDALRLPEVIRELAHQPGGRFARGADDAHRPAGAGKEDAEWSPDDGPPSALQPTPDTPGHGREPADDGDPSPLSG